MRSAHTTMSLATSDAEHALMPPPLFTGFAVLGTIAVIGYILASIFIAPASEPMFHFGENGAITALSSVTLAMSGALALMVFYLRMQSLDTGSVFWLILASGCVFLALDEQLMFHERGGLAIAASAVGESSIFRNWNDLIVIGYGVVALTLAALFGREILKCKAFAAFFAIGFAFYVVHTGIDSIVPNSVAWKDIPEESAKLMSVFSLFLALSAQLLALMERLLPIKSPGRQFGGSKLAKSYSKSGVV